MGHTRQVVNQALLQKEADDVVHAIVLCLGSSGAVEAGSGGAGLHDGAYDAHYSLEPVMEMETRLYGTYCLTDRHRHFWQIPSLACTVLGKRFRQRKKFKATFLGSKCVFVPEKQVIITCKVTKGISFVLKKNATDTLDN